MSKVKNITTDDCLSVYNWLVWLRYIRLSTVINNKHTRPPPRPSRTSPKECVCNVRSFAFFVALVRATEYRECRSSSGVMKSIENHRRKHPRRSRLYVCAYGIRVTVGAKCPSAMFIARRFSEISGAILGIRPILGTRRATWSTARRPRRPRELF